MTGLPVIPVETGDPLALLARHPNKALALLNAAAGTFGLASRIAARMLLPTTDRLSRDWLVRTDNPWLGEIDAFAAGLGAPGVHTLNTCFEWGCTSGVWPSPDGPTLRRVLDWAFPALGQNMIVAWQSGPTGDFLAVTWPGLSGLFQGLAPGRFAAAINQAPMRRHGGGFLGDWAVNRIAMKDWSGLPPAHLLRRIFENAADFAAAKDMLCRTPLAVPCIFILAGTGPGEGCVIERTEETFMLRSMNEGRVCAANHFEVMAGAWRPRPIDSAGRAVAARGLAAGGDTFAWFTPPIANAHSRLVLEASAATGALALMGVHGERPVTQRLTVNPSTVSVL